jgi:polysaccharide biosynthesis transport protein
MSETLAFQVDASRGPSAKLSAGADDAVRQLWGSVFFSPERKAPQTVVITSAEPREGVTEIACALALVGSASRRIALVEFNFRRPRVGKLFGLSAGPGAAEVMAGDAELGAAMKSVGAQLHVLQAGGKEKAFTLHSEAVVDLLGQLTREHDHVIIDAPCANREATAQALGGLTDGVLLVARSGVTRREAVADAKKRIEMAQGKVLGVILNRRKYPIPGFLYRRL